MASLFDKVAKLARTEQGRRIIGQATAKVQQLSKDPATRAKVDRVRDEVSRRMSSRRRPQG